MTKTEVPILNPSFDPPFTARPDPELGGPPVGEVTVAEGWQPYYDAQKRRPEWTQYQQYQKVFGTFSEIRAGVYQRVQVGIGDLLTLVVRACFTSDGAGVALRVGIDPFGGTDFQSEEIIWGSWNGETAPPDSAGYWQGGLDDPRYLSVENVEPEAPYVTLFLHIENLYAGKDESAFWDLATLYREGDPDPEPPDPGEGWAELLFQVTRIADAVEAIAKEQYVKSLTKR
jgi:hypothetical protein